MSVLEKVNKVLRRSPPRITREEYLKKLVSKGLNPDGTPVLDPTPIAPPIGYKKQPSMVEVVRDMVRSQNLANEAARAGLETFEEAEDFDIGDEPELMRSQWENEFDPPLSVILAEGQKEIERKLAQGRAAAQNSKVPKKEAPQEPKPPTDGPNDEPE